MGRRIQKYRTLGRENGLHMLLFACLFAVIGVSVVVLTRAAPSTRIINMVGHAYSATSLTITAGDTVTWTNNDDVPHTVTSDTSAWDSGLIPIGGSYSRTFPTPGTYAYHCAFHPTMLATITVVAAAPKTGDVNNDGQVNIFDLSILLNHYSQTVPPNTLGDLTGDGMINVFDLSRMLGNWGK